MAKLNDAEIAESLKTIPAWTVANGKLHREYKFANFQRAIEYMTAAMDGIERMNHHPEWANVYNRISVDLVTHSEQGITRKDFELAAHLDSIAQKFA